MASEDWYVRRGVKESGPFTSDLIRQLARSGKLLPTDSLRMGSGGSYTQASRVRGIFPAITANPQSVSNLENASLGSGPPPLPNSTSTLHASTKTSGLATASLILGALSPFLSCITGLPGLACGLLGLRRIRKSERPGQSRLSGRGLAKAGIALSAGFMIVHALILPGLILPAVQSAREASRRSGCSNNLKQILLGMHVYADATARGGDNFFPTDIRDPDGTPLLSWRVALLPYLDEQELYRKFRLTEAWDSPHNIQLLSEMPACYSCPSHREDQPAGMTSYIAVSGGGFFLDPSGKPRSVSDFTDGTSRSIAIVEIPPSMAIQWTKPDPLMGNTDAFLEATAESHAGSLFGVGFADGHVAFLSARDFDRSLFRSSLTIAEGESIPEN